MFLKKLPEEELTFESMKRVLTEPPEIRKEAEAERREQLNHTFRTATFSELVRRTQPKVCFLQNENVCVNFWFCFQHDILQNKLNEIFKSISTNESFSPDRHKKDVPIYEQNFPELFVN